MIAVNTLHFMRIILSLIHVLFCIFVYIFSLILLAIGGVAHRAAFVTGLYFFQEEDYQSSSSLLISGGFFGVIISFIGALGTTPFLSRHQNNFYRRIGLINLIIYILALFGLFILEISAGVSAYTRWDSVSTTLELKLRKETQEQYGLPNFIPFTVSIDSVQMEFECCGISNRSDWDISNWALLNGRYTPLSCCKDELTSTNNSNGSYSSQFIGCSRGYAYNQGCWGHIEDILRGYTLTVGRVAVPLAILQLVTTCIPIALLVSLVLEFRNDDSLEFKIQNNPIT